MHVCMYMCVCVCAHSFMIRIMMSTLVQELIVVAPASMPKGQSQLGQGWWSMLAWTHQPLQFSLGVWVTLPSVVVVLVAMLVKVPLRVLEKA